MFVFSNITYKMFFGIFATQVLSTKIKSHKVGTLIQVEGNTKPLNANKSF